MSKKWLDREGPKWVEQQFINDEQLQQIRGFYGAEKSAYSLLPILASVLIALSLLTFIASNWGWLVPEWRLVVLAGVMIGFYVWGFNRFQKGSEALGISLIGLGLAAFGAALILIGQTYHLVTYHAGTFIVWGIAGIALTWLFRSQILFIATLVILQIAQLYSINELNQFSYVVLALMLVGLGAYWWLQRTQLLSWLIVAAMIAQASMLIVQNDWPNMLIFVAFLLLYVLGDALRADSKDDRAALHPLQTVPLAAAFITCVILIFMSEYDIERWVTGAAVTLPLLLLLTGLSGYFKMRNGTLAANGYQLALFLPFVYLEAWTDISFLFYLIAVFGFSLLLLLRGYDVESRTRVNIGTFLFLLSCFFAYAKLTWGFLDRSLFFLVGGLLLFGLSWFLNQRRKRWLAQQAQVVKGGDGDE